MSTMARGTTIWLRLVPILLVLLLSSGCETTTDAPSPWVQRYEIMVPAVDDDGHPRSVVQREAILRSMIADFGVVVVTRSGVVGYGKAADGMVMADTHWRVVVDVPGKDAEKKMIIVREKFEAAYGKNDVWIVRFPVEKVNPETARPPKE